MRECITILNGQAGLQIGDICWDVFADEHGINLDGSKSTKKIRNDNELLDTLFNETSRESHYVPRSIMVDNDPSVIDQILRSEKGQFYSSRMAIKGLEDAANNFSRGFYTVSDRVLESTMDCIRKSMELCESFQGFLMFSSFGGGTGSGLTARLIDELEKYYNKKNRLEFNVFPSSQMSTAIVEPYNALFRAHTSLFYSSPMFLFDNEACFRLCQNELSVDRPHYYHINQLISQVASSITASTRFGGQLNVDLAEFETNLVPFPRMHFLGSSYSPLLNREKSFCQNLSTKEMTRRCFESKNQMIEYKPSDGKYISCCLLYRGNVTPKDVFSSVNDIKSNRREPIEFVKWSPTGMKTGISMEPPSMLGDLASVDRALCLCANNTALVKCWELLNSKVNKMYRKRAFVHWYVAEGMEELEFQEAIEDIDFLIQDYKELEMTGEIDESRYKTASNEDFSLIHNGFKPNA
ncbi:Tubulin alpha-3 chain [Sarcoptes scabiei]|uniref:Tubulin alpha chain n=1 Tax=Sarcoptes scabiei TaxID=52283 RepID=A0A834VHB0_SARSC|nr:Tubulin alpha-3 chain [Sarcoptes scabiei]